MKQAFAELYYVITHLVSHKITFARIGCKMKLPLWLILAHDLTKLAPSELAQYIRNGRERPGNWLHYEHSKHHWQHWNGQDMPRIYATEMVTDWHTASIEKHENTATWYQANKPNITLSVGTADYVENLIRGTNDITL